MKITSFELFLVEPRWQFLKVSTDEGLVEALETNQPFRFNGNVPNRHLIPNLPEGCCVKVLCLADGNGIQRTVVGELPKQLAALNRTNINVQELIVEAALTGNLTWFITP